MLEPGEANEVRDAIVTDTAITERQKQVLLDIYASFLQQNDAVTEVDTVGASPSADAEKIPVLTAVEAAHEIAAEEPTD
jgi:hypothetical protein